jgi:hypothetical protein
VVVNKINSMRQEGGVVYLCLIGVYGFKDCTIANEPRISADYLKLELENL